VHRARASRTSREPNGTEVSDGQVRRIGAGSPILFEDTTGQGHATRVLADSETLALFLPLAD
jgi:hypothetical protein